MDDIDRQLLILFQKEIPLKPRPFEIFGRAVGVDSADVMLRLNRLQEDQVLGRISAIFDIEKMGYQYYLIAMKTAPEQVDQAVYYVSEHPGVTQCSRRRGSFNLWFSITLPRTESLEFHGSRLKELSGAEKFLVLKTAKVYKSFGEGRKKITYGSASGGVLDEITEAERKLIQALQENFPVVDHPYRKIAKDLGSSEELVLKQMQFFQKTGILKKIAAGSFPKEKEFESALVLWNIPEEKIDAAGNELTGFSEVSFCAKRMPYMELPYNLYVTIENTREEKILELLQTFERRIGMWPRECLMKEKEEKRGRLKYFSREIEDWRLQHEGQSMSLGHL